MFMDTKSQGEPWEGGRLCRSCHRPIAANEATEELRFDADCAHKLHELNGSYHADCAKPLLSVKRAFDAIGRLSF